jgi:5'-3' exonuclease
MRALATKRGLPSGHIFGTFRAISSYLKVWAPMRLIVALDRKQRDVYEMYPAYKGRKHDLQYDPTTEVRNLFLNLPCYLATARDTEADHVIATVAARIERLGGEVKIISTDKDLWALMSPQVQLHRSARELFTDRDVRANFDGLGADKIALHKAMFGDSSDNLPKFDGHRVRKTDLVVEAVRAAHDIPSLYEQLQQRFQSNASNPAAWPALQEFRRQAEINYFAAWLRTDLELSVGVAPGDPDGLRNILERYECLSLLTSVDQVVKDLRVDDTPWLDWVN